MLLSDSQIRHAQPREKTFRLSDGEGLSLVITPKGKKYWQYRYDFGKKPQTISYGNYPNVSLEAARLEKKKDQDLLRQNINPSSYRKEEKALAIYRDENTFEEVARDWFTNQMRLGKWSEKRASLTMARLENHVFPYLGNRVIYGIKPIEVLGVIQRIEARGYTYLSHEVLWIINSVFKRAVKYRGLATNPASDISEDLLSHEVTNMPAIEEGEIPNLLWKLDNYEKGSELVMLATWLVLFTAVRQCELRRSEKTDIFFDRKEWVLRPEVTKMKREHIVPLSDQAIVVLKRLFALAPDSKWLVPVHIGIKSPAIGADAINHLLHKLGFKGKLTGHGFRALFSTTLNDHGFNRNEIDRHLGHITDVDDTDKKKRKSNKIEAAYNRAHYLVSRREFVQWWGDFLDEQRPNGKRFCSERFEPQGISVQGSFASLTDRVMDFSFDGVSSNDEADKKVAVFTTNQQFVHNFQTAY